MFMWLQLLRGVDGLRGELISAVLPLTSSVPGMAETLASVSATPFLATVGERAGHGAKWLW